jgi:aminoglycoside phosphotransferase (APT) family kinase protein
MSSLAAVADIGRLVVAHLPGYRVESVVPAGAGLENLAYEVNGELIVRIRRRPDPALVIREAEVLATVAEVSPVPVPVPVFSDPSLGCLAYRKLPGLPLLGSPGGAPVAAALGEFLAAVHTLPVERMAALVDHDDPPLIEWRDEAASLYAAVAGRVPVRHRDPVAAFLSAPPPDGGYRPVFSHNDLGIEHVLVDGDRVTGVIDWSDAAIVDPAYDFGLLYRDLGPDRVRAALRRYRSSPALEERALFYARCSVFEDLAYGIETGRQEYAEKSLAALDWLFPA